jgi:prevent-host-death family protein
LTIHVHRRTLIGMSLRTSSTRLKAKMGQYMRAVRAGKEVVVTDRDQPVARLLPYRQGPDSSETLEVVQPREPTAPPLGQVEVQAIRYRGSSTTALLATDRGRR